MEVISALLLFLVIMLWMQNRKLMTQLKEIDKIRGSLEKKIEELKDEKPGKLNLSSLRLY